jgi:hypothetical protein
VADFDFDQPMRSPDALTRVMAGKPFAPEVGKPAVPYNPFAQPGEPTVLSRVRAGQPFAPEVGKPAVPYSPFAGLRAMQSRARKP